MEFTERRYSVLLVSSSPKFNESMLALLPESRFIRSPLYPTFPVPGGAFSKANTT